MKKKLVKQLLEYSYETGFENYLDGFKDGLYNYFFPGSYYKRYKNLKEKNRKNYLALGFMLTAELSRLAFYRYIIGNSLNNLKPVTPIISGG